jgi:hypothetical protein
VNVWDQMREALAQADNIDSAIASNSNRMAQFLTRHRGANLRRVSPSELRELKRSLRDFDMTTGAWKR